MSGPWCSDLRECTKIKTLRAARFDLARRQLQQVLVLVAGRFNQFDDKAHLRDEELNAAAAIGDGRIRFGGGYGTRGAETVAGGGEVGD